MKDRTVKILAAILAVFFGHKGVWMSFPIADTLSIIMAAILLAALFRKFRKLNDGDDPDILGSRSMSLTWYRSR